MRWMRDVYPVLQFAIAGTLFPSQLSAQSIYLSTPKLTEAQGTISSRPPSNSVSQMATPGSVLWLGTSKGLTRTFDSGRSWENFRSDPAFASNGIFAIAVKRDTVWSSTGYSQKVDESRVQTGTGYAFSIDNGLSWTHRAQPLDEPDDSLKEYGSNLVRFLPIIVDEQNVTFDMALSDSFVWIASWSSGLRRSRDLGESWERIVLPNDLRNSISPDDSLGRYVVDPRRNNNFLAFSVFVKDASTIWAGTAGGVNKSTDGGTSWSKFTTLNQQAHILGNWVIAIEGQQLSSGYRLWTTNWKADLDPNEKYGISYTDDGGRIWRNLLHDTKAYDFAFKDSIAYVATDDGVYRTTDGGISWSRSGTIIDKYTRQRITSVAVFAVGVIGDTVYCGTSDGLARTVDNDAHPFGQTWEILRTYREVGKTGTTYAYPNPFSPDDEIVRIHYGTGGDAASVTVEVFDFGMNRVRTIIKDADRSGSAEHDEIWNGLDDYHRQVANGVYFYKVVMNGSDPLWGKILVLQ